LSIHLLENVLPTGWILRIVHGKGHDFGKYAGAGNENGAEKTASIPFDCWKPARKVPDMLPMD
jgi:hypothetical protein